MKHLFVLLGGLAFGFGLALSGMAEPEVVLAFLHLEDLGLLVVMGSAVLVTTIAYQLGPRLLREPWCGEFQRLRPALRARTCVGALVFGVGWGVSGVCPGAALASLGIGNTEILLWLGATLAGAYAQAWWFPERRAADV